VSLEDLFPQIRFLFHLIFFSIKFPLLSLQIVDNSNAVMWWETHTGEKYKSKFSYRKKKKAAVF